MKKIINFRPLLFVALSLCMGIATAYFLMREKTAWAIFFISAFVACVLLYLFLFTPKDNKKKSIIVAIILSLVFVFGVVNLYGQLNNYSSDSLGGAYYRVEGRVKSAYQTDSGNKIVLDNVIISGELKGKLRYNMAVTVYGDIDLDIGDVIVFYEHIRDNSYIYEQKFNASDVERGIRYNATVNAEQITKTAKSLTIFESVNVFIRDTLNNGLDKDEFSVGYALLTGDDSFMDYDLISAYRTAGVAHIFAVSGLHIGFLAVALAFIFKKLKIGGYTKAILITLFVLFYSGVCGFSSSSIRATIMTATVLFARAKGDRYDFLSSVSLACILILLISPVNLLCVGFQLSFGVVLGINLFAKQFEKPFKFLPEKLRSALGVVISAQVVAIPISLASFGYFSWISVIANLVFIPFVSILFTFSFFACIIGGIFSIPKITLFIPNYALKFANLLMIALDSQIFIIGGIVLGSGIIAFYLSLIVPSGIIRIKPKLKSILTIVFVLIFMLTGTLNTIHEINAVKVYVSGAERISATLIKDKNQSALIISNTEYVYSVSRLSRIAKDSGVDRINHLIFTGGYPLDMQVFITKLYTVFDIENVHYYGEQDAQMEGLISTFFSVKVQSHSSGESVRFGTTSLTYTLDGRALCGKINGYSVAILSPLSSEQDFSNFNAYGLDYMICCDRADALLSKYKPKNAISYLSSSLYQDAQSKGNLTLNFS